MAEQRPVGVKRGPRCEDTPGEATQAVNKVSGHFLGPGQPGLTSSVGRRQGMGLPARPKHLPWGGGEWRVRKRLLKQGTEARGHL